MPSLLLVSSPPSITVISLMLVPRFTLRISLPLPNSIRPLTVEPLFSVTLALPSSSLIASPDVAETRLPVLSVIVVVLPALSWLIIPAPEPPVIWFAKVIKVLPVPELRASMPLIPPVILPPDCIILISVVLLPFSAQIP